MRVSVLDLIYLAKGQTAAQAIEAAVDLARYVEELGFARYWIAEHHDSAGLASSAPEILIGHLAQATRRIRVGSGGIMLPNHSTLHIAEVFRTLSTLHPGRIDLGLGRAPGTGSRASAALRKGKPPGADDFPDEVADLMAYFADGMPVRAIPLGAVSPEIWMLGSSDFGARLAARMGIPYAFAQHFSSLNAAAVMGLYRDSFRPSPFLAEPRVAMGCHVICAETDARAEELALSSDLSMSTFIRTGQSDPLRSAQEAVAIGMARADRDALRAHFPKFVGSPETVRRELAPYLGVADEIIAMCAVPDPVARKESYRLLAEALR